MIALSYGTIPVDLCIDEPYKMVLIPEHFETGYRFSS